jgi:hypothetical protein
MDFIRSGNPKISLQIGITLKIQEWLDTWGVEGYSIDPNYLINCDQDVCLDFESQGLSLNLDKIRELPEYINFGVVKGSFWIQGQDLISLRGCPKIIHRDFFCGDNLLTDFSGGPIEVSGWYYASGNPLSSLTGLAKEIGGGFRFASTPISNDETAGEAMKISKIKEIMID